MAIVNAVQRGSFVYVYNEKNQQIGTQSACHPAGTVAAPEETGWKLPAQTQGTGLGQGGHGPGVR